jgi:hypothetical protein
VEGGGGRWGCGFEGAGEGEGDGEDDGTAEDGEEDREDDEENEKNGMSGEVESSGVGLCGGFIRMGWKGFMEEHSGRDGPELKMESWIVWRYPIKACS